MTPLSILRKARKLITPRAKWTKATSARRKDGTACDVLSTAAVSFCSVGAIRRRGGWHAEANEARDALNNAIKTKVGGGIIEYNDAPSRTHKQVLALFDRAIAKLAA